MACAPIWADVDVELSYQNAVGASEVRRLASRAVNPPRSFYGICTSECAGTELCLAVGGYGIDVFCPTGSVTAELYDVGRRAVLVGKAEPQFVIPIRGRGYFHTVAKASYFVSNGCRHQDIWQLVVAVPAVDAEFLSGLREVARQDMPFEHFHIGKLKQAATADITFVEVSEVFTGLCVDDLNCRAAAVDAVEFAVVVGKVTHIRCVPTFLRFGVAFLREVPFFAHICTSRAKIGLHNFDRRRSAVVDRRPAVGRPIDFVEIHLAADFGVTNLIAVIQNPIDAIVVGYNLRAVSGTGNGGIANQELCQTVVERRFAVFVIVRT